MKRKFIKFYEEDFGINGMEKKISYEVIECEKEHELYVDRGEYLKFSEREIGQLVTRKESYGWDRAMYIPFENAQESIHKHAEKFRELLIKSYDEEISWLNYLQCQAECNLRSYCSDYWI